VDYGVYGIPELFFITGEGRIAAKHIGVIGPTRLLARLEEVRGGIVSARAGQGEQYQSIR
jgi:hypothetical protein